MSEAINENVFVPVMLPAAMAMIEEYPDIPADVINSEIIEDQPQEITSPITQEPVQVLKMLFSDAQFKELVKSVSSLTPECRMDIWTGGIEIRAVNTANVSMVQVKYDKPYFESYKCTGLHEIGIDLSVWVKFLKNVKKGNLVALEITQHHKEQTETQKKENKPGEIFYRYNLSCNGSVLTDHFMDIETIRKKPNVPTIELTTTIDLYASELIDAIKAARDVSDKVEFLYDGNGALILTAMGDHSVFKKSLQFKAWGGVKARSLYSIEYLYDIVRSFQNKKEIITIDLKDDHPLRIRMNESIDREIVFLLAPRIEAD
jgi:proliferating cell nuclear antigen